MVVNNCDVAETVDVANGLNSYTNTTCANSTVISENVEKVRVTYKTIQKIFNPEFYAENDHMHSAVTVRGENQLINALSVSKHIEVVAYDIQFFHKKLINL